jgi:hypothetical protein
LFHYTNLTSVDKTRINPVSATCAGPNRDFDPDVNVAVETLLPYMSFTAVLAAVYPGKPADTLDRIFVPFPIVEPRVKVSVSVVGFHETVEPPNVTFALT